MKELESIMKRLAEVPTATSTRIGQLFTGIPIRLHFRSDLHLVRKTFHLVMGLVIVYCYLAGTPRWTAVSILGSFLGLDLMLEASRLRNPAFNGRFLRFWGPLMRAHEVQRLSTVPHYISSAMLAIAVFPKPVAILSLLYLAFGDPVASLIGILYGHHGPRFTSGKTAIGTGAGVFVCGLLSLVYLKSLEIPSDSTLLVLACIGGLAGGLAELLPLEIDDNFTIPVVSGFAVWLAFIFYGI
jgi:dolichol kinase